MAQFDPKRLVPSEAVREIFNLWLGSLLIGSLLFIGVRSLHAVTVLERFGVIITIVQYTMPALFVLVAVYGTVDELRKARARQANERVGEALAELAGASPQADVAGITPEEVAARVKGAKVSNDQLLRLAEQQKQQLLIDDDAFRNEVSRLIVAHLQPLPRNAKRVLNRFRVNVLIASQRGLLTTAPKVTPQQIGKWLVMDERWPQLRLSLSAVPERMKELEAQASRRERFEELIKDLAPFYVGDEDLRIFVQAAPLLAPVLPRLVHYGAAA